MGAIGLLFTMASLGLPGLGNFVAEFLILAGSYQTSIYITAIAVLGLIASTIYSLRIMQKVFYGNKVKEWSLRDFNFREMIIMGSLIIIIVWQGIFPQTFLNTSMKSMENLYSNTQGTKTVKAIKRMDFGLEEKTSPPIQNKRDISYINDDKKIREER